ncbi:hypothetical protein [Rossellomorea sp. DA94]|uniref:hypothetical protein n=1 Tax=Rossellomorea sp. DA94 TaxID=3038653 RepID=UPI002448841F|nr:hypothetical protein [Rossellomorea sp. DA94]WGG47675.1 hypothetical protein P8596_10895 [Rossellomorea sp. DA94]
MALDTLFDAVKELYIRMLSGETLEEAKRCLKYHEDLFAEEKEELDKCINGLMNQFGIDELEAMRIIYNSYLKGSM